MSGMICGSGAKALLVRRDPHDSLAVESFRSMPEVAAQCFRYMNDWQNPEDSKRRIREVAEQVCREIDEQHAQDAAASP